MRRITDVWLAPLQGVSREFFPGGHQKSTYPSQAGGFRVIIRRRRGDSSAWRCWRGALNGGTDRRSKALMGNENPR